VCDLETLRLMAVDAEDHAEWRRTHVALWLSPHQRDLQYSLKVRQRELKKITCYATRHRFLAQLLKAKD